MLMKWTIVLVALAVAGGAMILGASAEAPTGPAAVRKTECQQQAKAQDFGIHEFQHHRFVTRCVAGLLQR
jgi:hypothetical protein